jgi:hypothetical protein
VPLGVSLGAVLFDQAAIKLHTLLDLRGNIPSFIRIRDGKWHEINLLDELITEPGAFYVMDRGDIECERLGRLSEAGSFFYWRQVISSSSAATPAKSTTE